MRIKSVCDLGMAEEGHYANKPWRTEEVVIGGHYYGQWLCRAVWNRRGCGAWGS